MNRLNKKVKNFSKVKIFTKILKFYKKRILTNDSFFVSIQINSNKTDENNKCHKTILAKK